LRVAFGVVRSAANLHRAVARGLRLPRDGIPVRWWVWPEDTANANVVAEVKRNLNDGKFGRLMLVMDAGFNSETDRCIV
jgi:hypothetical protein